MSNFVYILFSTKLSKFYVGQTSNVKARMLRHNSGRERYTSTGLPWKLLWTAEKSSRGEALKLEKKLKNLSQARLIAFMLKYREDVASPDELLFIKQLSGC